MLKNHFLWFTVGHMTIMKNKIPTKEMIVKFNYVLKIVAPLLLFYTK